MHAKLIQNVGSIANSIPTSQIRTFSNINIWLDFNISVSVLQLKIDQCTFTRPKCLTHLLNLCWYSNETSWWNSAAHMTRVRWSSFTPDDIDLTCTIDQIHPFSSYLRGFFDRGNRLIRTNYSCSYNMERVNQLWHSWWCTISWKPHLTQSGSPGETHRGSETL